MKDRYFGMRGGWLTFWVTVACGTDMTLFGYDQGVFGGVIVTPDFLQTLGIDGDAHAGIRGTVTALYDIGCFFGAIAAFVVGDMLGRKKTILLGTTIMSIGAILQISTFTVPHMIVGRIVAGIGNGINTATAPPWQAETSKAAWRGKLIVIELILNIAGFALSTWVTFGLSYASGGISWRLPLAIQFIFIFIIYATVPWLPESPRWLVQKGRIEEAEQILADIEGSEIEDPYVQTELGEIKFAAEYEETHKTRLRDLVRGKAGSEGGTCALRRVLLGMGSQAMQQLSGINVTSYYLPTVLITSVGFSNKMARLIAACNSLSYLAFSFIGIPNVERWGRRKMMMYAAAGQAFCYFMITVLIRFKEKYEEGAPNENITKSGKVGAASVAFFFLYYVFFGIGFQGVPWLYPAEINTLALRQKGAALGTATNWIFNFMVVEITPIGVQTLRWKFYIIWTVLNASFVPLVYFFYPETAGRTLEDLDAYFREQPGALVFRDKAATSSSRPIEYMEKENQEVHRRSSATPQAMQLAQAHRRFSQISADMETGSKRNGSYHKEK